ncbi:UNVERIFIED_CONTAM: hypothetical protein FKN15_024344 [Acipenser sinensis]
MVFVTILDENDNAPVFVQLVYEATFREGPATAGSVMLTVSATDQDQGLNGTILYHIAAGNVDSTFYINKTTGTVVTLRELDYEVSHGRYTLIITATDQCPNPSQRLQSSATVCTQVLVNVIDVNDVTPTFPRSFEGPFDITEGQPGPRVWTLRAQDEDSGPNGQVEYSIVSGDPQNEFVISPVEGELRVRRDAELDRENIAFYNITVQAKDLGMPAHSSTVVVSVRVLDINDNDPILLNLPMNTSVSEGAPVSTSVSRVLAFDGDSGRNALLTFNITAGNTDNAFYINETDSDSLLISVSDENDNRPLFTEPSYRAQITENSPAGTPVSVLNGPILARDNDLGPNAVVTYRLLGSRLDLFTVDSRRGVVSVRGGAILDREALSDPRLELVLVAEDVGQLNSSASLSITVLDENDNRPVFNPAVLSVRLRENSLAGVVVTQVSASDADSGANGWLTYRIEGGAQDRFVMDSSSGVLLVGNAMLDREERDSYRLIVVASDHGTPPLSGTATLSVVLEDLNDSRPEFLIPVQTVNIDESTPPGAVIAQVTATDRDLRPRLEYYIIEIQARDDTNSPVAGQQDVFGIDFHSGAVFVRSPLNRELVATFDITISVHDNASDVIEQSVSVPNAVDPDKGHNGQVTYQLLNLPLGGYVRLEDPSAGKIIANRTVDFEQVQWLNFTVRAQDQGAPPRFAELPVFLQIIDINDNNPVFSQPSYQKPVFEDIALGTVILRVSATDSDSGRFALIEYGLVDGEGRFGINPSTGDIYILSPLDREKKDHYTLTAVAKDNPGDSASNRRENSVQYPVCICVVDEYPVCICVVDEYPVCICVVDEYPVCICVVDEYPVCICVVDEYPVCICVVDEYPVCICVVDEYPVCICVVDEYPVCICVVDEYPVCICVVDEYPVCICVVDEYPVCICVVDEYPVCICVVDEYPVCICVVDEYPVCICVVDEYPVCICVVDEYPVCICVVDEYPVCICVVDEYPVCICVVDEYPVCICVVDEYPVCICVVDEYPVCICVVDEYPVCICVVDEYPVCICVVDEYPVCICVVDEYPVCICVVDEYPVCICVVDEYPVCICVVDEYPVCICVVDEYPVCICVVDEYPVCICVVDEYPVCICVVDEYPVCICVVDEYPVCICVVDEYPVCICVVDEYPVCICVVDEYPVCICVVDEYPVCICVVDEYPVCICVVDEYPVCICVVDEYPVCICVVDEYPVCICVVDEYPVCICVVDEYPVCICVVDEYPVCICVVDEYPVCICVVDALRYAHTHSSCSSSIPLFSVLFYRVTQTHSPLSLPAEAFLMDPDSGLVRSQRLLQSFEHFNLTVVGTDRGRPPLWGTTSLQIDVIDVNDNRPVFVRPANGTIMHILEEQPPGLVVYEVFATDRDEGVNGEVRYSFLQTGAGNKDWENFSIDPVSGVITTAVRLDREKQALHNLIIVAYDLGQPVPYETTQPLQVALTDIDDNEPVFLKPPALFVPEHSSPGVVVGNVTGAVDADDGSNAVVYYFIAGGDGRNNFQLTRDGVLRVTRDMDREVTPFYSFIVKASSDRSWSPPRGQRSSWQRALNPSTDPTLQEVRVFLEDINDQSPVFLKPEYTAGVAADAKVGSDLIRVQAVDADVGNNSLIVYHILAIRYIKLQSNDSEDVGNVFIIGETDGIVRTFDLFTAYKPGYFVVDVLASDLAGHSDTTTLGIYILRDDQRVKIVINEIPERVRQFQEEFINLLSNITGAIVNTDDVQFHVDKKGRVNFAQTDMLIHVVNKQTNRILDVERVIQMIDENMEQLRNLFRNYNVLDVQPAVSGRAPDDLTTLQTHHAATQELQRRRTMQLSGSLQASLQAPSQTTGVTGARANPVWLDPYCRNLELAAQAGHEDDLPENLSDITDLWNSPARTHGTFGREPQASKPEDDRYLRAAIQEYDNIAKLGQIMREGPIKGSLLNVVLDDYLRLKKLFAARLVTKSASNGDQSSVTELIQSDLDEDEEEERSPGRGGTLRFKHKLPVEFKGPDGIHTVHGSTGTLLTSDLNSLPEDDQKALVRSLEALQSESGPYSERNARTESAKSTPLHKAKEGISGSPLEITEL